MNANIQDFWKRWFSNLLTNNLRGILAEYLVASSLWVTQQPRVEWDAYDVISPEWITIEVKSSAYVQWWEQKKPSKISFSIRETRLYNEESQQRDLLLKRQSDVYVFCLLAHQDKETINPLNLDQWDIYVLPTAVLNEQCTTQKTISLNKLIALWAIKTSYWELYNTIKAL